MQKMFWTTSLEKVVRSGPRFKYVKFHVWRRSQNKPREPSARQTWTPGLLTEHRHAFQNAAGADESGAVSCFLDPEYTRKAVPSKHLVTLKMMPISVGSEWCKFWTATATAGSLTLM